MNNCEECGWPEPCDCEPERSAGSLERVVGPQPDEPCPLCEAKGWRMVISLKRYGLLVKTECCDCHGKGRRPVRPNAKLRDAGESGVEQH